MNHVKPQNKGFTLIELMLAMSFISVLLLGIAMTIIQIGVIYNKGMTYKEVNQASRDISDDIRRTVSAGVSLNFATDYVTSSAGGRLCTGTYSYIWNTAKAAQQGDTNLVIYASKPDKVRLVKVPDSAKQYCVRDGSDFELDEIRSTDTLAAKELLKPGDRELQVNQFVVQSDPQVSDAVTGQRLYTVSYTIGAGDISTMNLTQSACLAPGNNNANPEYCTVQQFSLVIRAGNRVN